MKKLIFIVLVSLLIVGSVTAMTGLPAGWGGGACNASSGYDYGYISQNTTPPPYISCGGSPLYYYYCGNVGATSVTNLTNFAGGFYTSSPFWDTKPSGYYGVLSGAWGYGECARFTFDNVYHPLPAAPTTNISIQTTIFLVDGLTGNPIVGGTLNIRDVQNNTWINTTSTLTGYQVHSLPGHTLDIYGSYPSPYTPSYELDAYPGGPYYLPLFTYVVAPIGSVNLLVNLRESVTGLAIQNAIVNIRYGTGGATTQSANTANSGSAPFVVPNNTVIIIDTSPSGYNGQSMSTTIGAIDKQVTITLSKSTIPTTTPAPVVTNPITGEIIPGLTAVPTYVANCNPIATDYDAGMCSRNQDSGMMATLREWGPNILMLAILAVIFGLLKMIMKF